MSFLCIISYFNHPVDIFIAVLLAFSAADEGEQTTGPQPYDEEYDYLVTIEKKGPLGFELEFGIVYNIIIIVDGYLQVTKIVPKSFADKCGMIEVGDRLVEINNYPLEGVDLVNFADILAKSNYPRDLVFCPINPWDRDTAEEKVYEPEGVDAIPNKGQIYLNITSPFIATGFYNLTILPYGKLQLEDKMNIEITVVDDTYCRSLNSDKFDNKYVIVWRGQCSMIEKAKSIFKHGGKGIIIVNNVYKDYSPLPTSNEKPFHEIPMLFMDWIPGTSLIKSFLLNSETIKGVLTFNNSTLQTIEVTAKPQQPKQGDSSTTIPTDPKKRGSALKEWLAQKKNKKAGKGSVKQSLQLYFQTPTGNYTFATVRAVFGKLAPNYPYPVFYAENGCYGFKQDVRGGFILVDRGMCDFDYKTKNIQQVGGTGSIIINNENQLYEIHGGSDSDQINIPTYLIQRSDGKIIKTLLYEGTPVCVRVLNQN